MTFLGLTFTLVLEGERSWRRIRAHERIAELMNGVVFRGGEPVILEEQELLWYVACFADRASGCNAPHLSSGHELRAVTGSVFSFDLTRRPIPTSGMHIPRVVPVDPRRQGAC